VLEVIEQLRKSGKTKIELQAITQDERSNSLIVAGKHEELVVVQGIISALETLPPANQQPQNPPATSDALSERLRALDVKEAELNLRAAQANLNRLQAMVKVGAAAVTQQELLAAQLAAEKAALALESIKAAGDPVALQKIEVRQAEARLRAARTSFERVTVLTKDGAIPLTELEVAKLEAERAEIDLERAMARLQALQSKEKPEQK